MSGQDQAIAGFKADEMIATEVAIQDRMWGDANERADATKNQLLAAAVAQLVLIKNKLDGHSSETAVAVAREFYPSD